MECPYCGAELEYDDYYGHYLGNNQWDKQGDIYKCPNCEGFSNEQEALKFIDINGYEDYYDTWEDIVCDSECFNGFFYTDKQGNLHEGYPC
jgi:hypothetical protein